MTNQAHTTFPSKKAAADHQRRMTALAVNTAEEEKHILADRYKTKMCKNYLAKGECPYEVRCMFAHGDEELRTSEDNVRDGLITEEAIKAFQRQQNQTKRRMAYAAIREAEERAAQQQQQQQDMYLDAEVDNSNEDMYYSHPHESMNAPRFVPHALSQQHPAGFYTHNPYAYNIIPAESREFAIYAEAVPVEEEEAYWYEEQAPVAAAEEEYYFPSSEMMAPLVPSVAAAASARAQRPQHYKLYDSIPSGSFSDEGAAYNQGESADYAPYAKAAHCTAADLPDFEQEAPMVLEP